jgi:putative exporter of polyketide antibiotics
VKSARALFYIHLVLTVTLVVLACRVLAYHSKQGSNPPQLEQLFSSPAVRSIYVVLVFSCFVFPAILASGVVGRMSTLKWVVILIADIVLGLLQYAALGVLLPVRS